MRKLRGFTLIELLIVVAIIAILAAIAVPNFLEAQVRAKVTRAKSDMRSLATAIESYMVDMNQYPASADNTMAPVGLASVNSTLPNLNHAKRVTFASLAMGGGNRFMTITTPVSFISTLPVDPFAKKGCVFGYINAMDAGWIMWSYGPDATETGASLDGYFNKMSDWDTQGEWTAPNQSVYNPFTSNPTPELIGGDYAAGNTGYTYDTTNGSTSNGDVWQIMGGGG